MLINFKRQDIIVLFEWKNILITHDYEKGEFASSQSGGYNLDLKSITQHPSENYSLQLYHRSIVAYVTRRIDKSLIF